MTTDINNLLCVECGNRGFIQITVNKNNNNIPALQCKHCMSVLYGHEAMQIITAQNEQSATK